LGFFLLNDN